MEEQNLGRTKAPELDSDGGWLNVDRPLGWKELKGKVVLVDFWTYCCINCLHVLADLKYLEEKFKDDLVVIGVHSAKFQNERETENIRQAILRHEISHPVVNDAQFRIWKAFGVRSWPTLFLVDPEGYILGSVSGEGHREVLENTIASVIKDFKEKGQLKSGPFPLSPEKEKAGKKTPLSFPGKVLADAESNRLFIADTNHNRILITDLEGNLIDTIGTGKAGMDGGKFDRACFNHPQGMALHQQFLYVADTDNHLIRRADLNMKVVHTVAGVEPKKGTFVTGKKQPPTPLNSPWDVALLMDKSLFIAMAGKHQIWVFDICGNRTMSYAGSGMEGIVDGKKSDAQLAQPSGIKTDGKNLYFADSEVSAIRKVGLDPASAVVETVVGKGLFEFGDADGPLDAARFQHPLGLDVSGGLVYVADTYNHKIKTIHLQDGTVSTLLTECGGKRLNEPGGISVAGDRLYVADTNNHRICRADLSGKNAEVVELKGL